MDTIPDHLIVTEWRFWAGFATCWGSGFLAGWLAQGERLRLKALRLRNADTVITRRQAS